MEDCGVTFGAAMVEAIRFAREDPWTFFLTVPFAGAIGLVLMVLMLKVIVIGPLTKSHSDYERARREEGSKREPPLPFE